MDVVLTVGGVALALIVVGIALRDIFWRRAEAARRLAKRPSKA
jgi:hypothetical protein